MKSKDVRRVKKRLRKKKAEGEDGEAKISWGIFFFPFFTDSKFTLNKTLTT